MKEHAKTALIVLAALLAAIVSSILCAYFRDWLNLRMPDQPGLAKVLYGVPYGFAIGYFSVYPIMKRFDKRK